MNLAVRTTLALGLFLGAAVPSMPSPACAQGGAQAALVIDPGDEGETYRLCVRLPSGSTSGIELIELAGEQHGLAYELGNGGQTVCMLAGVGSSSGNECFGEYPDFWGYWRGSGGGWEWSGTGAASTVVEPGDVEGWSWGRGQDGSTHPAPPPTRFEEVCAVAAGSSDDRDRTERPERSRPGPTARRSNRSEPDPAPAAGSAHDGRRPEPGRVEGPTRDDREPAGGRFRARAGGGQFTPREPAGEGPTERPTEQAAEGLPAVATQDPSQGGLPVGPIAAIGLAALLFAAGLVTARSRSKKV